MKKLLALALVAVMAGSALAQPPCDHPIYTCPPDAEMNTLALFFGEPWTDANTNTDAIGVFGIPMYIVLLNPEEGCRGVEYGIRPVDGLAWFVLGLEFAPYGGLNLGTNTNVLCGFGSTVPFNADGMVLATYNMVMQTAGSIEMGPANPSSVENWGPAILGVDPTHLKTVNYPIDHSDSEIGPWLNNTWYKVATVGADGVVATEDKSLSSVKALFQ